MQAAFLTSIGAPLGSRAAPATGGAQRLVAATGAPRPAATPGRGAPSASSTSAARAPAAAGTTTARTRPAASAGRERKYTEEQFRSAARRMLAASRAGRHLHAVEAASEANGM